MTEWETYRLGDILNFRRGHDLPKTDMVNGEIPVAGSNGIIGYHNVSTQQCCSGDNVVLVLKTFKPKQQTQANLLEVQILWTSSKLMKELKSS